MLDYIAHARPSSDAQGQRLARARGGSACGWFGLPAAATAGCGPPWARSSCCSAAIERFAAVGASALARFGRNSALHQIEADLQQTPPVLHRAALLGAVCCRPTSFRSRPGTRLRRLRWRRRCACIIRLWLAGLVFCALSIALSRMMLGLHFLSDVWPDAPSASAWACLPTRFSRRSLKSCVPLPAPPRRSNSADRRNPATRPQSGSPAR